MPKVKLQGGCLCEAIRFEVNGDPERFYHCHCSRCRKSSGTGHATNLFVSNSTLVFTSGESFLTRFKVPGAERFTRQFCSNCGSPVARFVPEINGVVIPAGSIDDEIPMTPQARIFWDSRATWSCDGDSIPRFSEYPIR